MNNSRLMIKVNYVITTNAIATIALNNTDNTKYFVIGSAIIIHDIY